MPLLNALEFTRDNLSVAYRASSDLQRLTIHFRIDGEKEVIAQNTPILSLGSAIRRGMAGSDQFSPVAGQAPRPPLTFLKEGRIATNEHRFTLDVAGVAPIFLRLMVEILRAVGTNVPLRFLSIHGELPPDDGPLSVTERTVVRWLDDPLAYPRRWPKLTFPFNIHEVVAKGISIQITFGSRVEKEVRNQLELLLLGWSNLVVGYVSPEGTFVRQQLGPTMPKCAWTKTGMRCGIELFENTRGPAVDVLLNMLERVHVTMVPLQHVLVRI